MVQLHETRERCDAAEAKGKPCCRDCRGIEFHSTEYVEPLRDEVPYEIGYRK
jgi:hypothetical protein